MIEVWKNVVDFEELYQVSNLGNFRRHPDKKPKNSFRAKQLNRLGYFYVDMCKNNKKYKKTIHQLVAAAFIPNFIYGTPINHIDGNKQNNCLANLEISNSVHNNTHAHAIGLMPKQGKSKYHNVSTRLDKRYGYITYVASVKINSKRHYIGVFKLEVDAAKAVDAFLNSINDTVRKRNFP